MLVLYFVIGDKKDNNESIRTLYFYKLNRVHSTNYQTKVHRFTSMRL